MDRLLISTVRQHRHHAIVIRLRDEHVDIQVTLSLIGLLRQYVSRMRMATLDLASGSQAHSFCGTLVCLKFWHLIVPFSTDSSAAPRVLAHFHRSYVSSAQ